MKRAILALFGAAVFWVGAPSPGSAEIDGQAICEAYCLSVAAGCYVFLALPTGRDKCEQMYEGCTDGCFTALLDSE